MKLPNTGQVFFPEREMAFARLLLLCGALVFLPAIIYAREGSELIKIVALSRHGVRAPTQTAKTLSTWSQKAWPVWPVKHGDLTPRGALLVKAMWENLRGDLQRKGLLPDSACPGEGRIFIRADVDERTRATAQAMADGLAPGCDLGYAVADEKIDPLFHPVKAGLYRYEAIPAAIDVLGMTHGGLDRLLDDFSGSLELVGRITGEPAPALCSRFALMPKCELTDLPNAVSVSPDGSDIRIVGSLGIGSSVSEIFLLEWGEWPGVPAGWGEVDLRVLSQILPVHARVFDVVNRAPVVAWANGSSMLNEMTAALFGEHYDKRLNEASLVVFVGHDTNIANVGGLLGFDWQGSGYPPNGIPPAGALFLELWREDGQNIVKARFYSQPPGALHAAFDNDSAAHMPTVAVPRYAKTDGPANLTEQDFRELVINMTGGAPVAPRQEPPIVHGAQQAD